MRCGPVVPRSSATRGGVHDGQTYQKVRNNQSYTFLKSPAMVAEDPRCCREFSTRVLKESMMGPGRAVGVGKSRSGSRVQGFARESSRPKLTGGGWAVTGLSRVPV